MSRPAFTPPGVPDLTVVPPATRQTDRGVGTRSYPDMVRHWGFGAALWVGGCALVGLGWVALGAGVPLGWVLLVLIAGGGPCGAGLWWVWLRGPRADVWLQSAVEDHHAVLHNGYQALLDAQIALLESWGRRWLAKPRRRPDILIRRWTDSEARTDSARVNESTTDPAETRRLPALLPTVDPYWATVESSIVAALLRGEACSTRQRPDGVSEGAFRAAQDRLKRAGVVTVSRAGMALAPAVAHRDMATTHDLVMRALGADH